jgi:replicative DNA helicase
VSDQAQVAEAAVTALIANTYNGEAAASLAVSEPAEAQEQNQAEVEKFEFDADFQTQLATHAVRDVQFMRKVGHLIDPNFFENVGEAAVVNLALRFWRKYQQLPNRITAQQLLKDDLNAKVIRGDIKPSVIEAFKKVFVLNPDLSNSDFFAQNLADFARHQAVSNALLECVDLLAKKDFGKIESKMKAAYNVGINLDGDEYSYWARITERTAARKDRLAGLLPPTGVTTGIHELDQLLWHKGWGLRELSVLLGGPKTGKTTAMIGFAKAASLAGLNVLYVTLEVSRDIISTRADACVTDTLMKEVGIKPHEVEAKVRALQARAGAFEVAEYPSGTFTPSMLRSKIERYKSPAILPDGTTRPPITFHLVVVDYADLMRLDNPTNEPRENSRLLWIDLRGIADIENVAMLTATATNRDGIKATVADKTHVADDINKVRTVDLMISINKTDEEAAAGEARLNFTASRNQEDGFTVFIKQDMARMKFISKLLRVE